MLDKVERGKDRGNVSALLKLSRWIDSCDEWLGKLLGWLVLAAVLVSSLNAMARYTFNASSNAWLELQTYIFGAVFLLGAGYTMLRNEHIRIDIINSRLPARVRIWIDIFGHLFFVMPLCLILTVTGVPFFLRSFDLREGSSAAGGLLLWPAKLMVVACFVILLVQVVSELIKRVAVLRGLIPDPHEGHSAHGAEK